MTLPFNLKPTLSTYLYMAYPFGMVEIHRVPDAMLNWHIQLMFNPGEIMPDTPRLTFYPSMNIQGYSKFGWFDTKIHLSGQITPDYLDALERTLIDNLRQKRYIWTFADYFHVPDTINFAKTHFRHDLLIFGRNEQTCNFLGALYTKNGTLGAIQLSLEQLKNAISSPHARGIECDNYCRKDFLMSIAPIFENILSEKLDLAAIKAQLESYLTASFKFKIKRSPHSSLIENVCFGDERLLESANFGVGIYKAIGMYFEHCRNAKSLRYCVMITRLLLEHKLLMGIRFRRIMNLNKNCPEVIFQKWLEIEAQAKFVHLRVAMARSRYDLSAIKNIKRELESLESSESRFLAQLLGQIEFAKV